MTVGSRGTGPTPIIVSTIPADGSTIFTATPQIQFVFSVDMDTTRVDNLQVLMPTGMTATQLVWTNARTLNIQYIGSLSGYGAKRVELFDNYIVSTGNMPIPKAGGFAFNYADALPVFTSGSNAVSAVPNPATTDDIITFSTAASNTNGDALTFTWNFGDGSTGSGQSVTHQYTTADAYMVMVTVANVSGGMITAPLLVKVSQGAAANPPPTALPWTVTKTMVKLGFKKTGRDTIQVQGTVNLPAGYDPTNKIATVSVGAVNATFTMDKRGNAKTGVNRFKLTEKLKKKQFLGGDVKIQFTLRGAFATALAASGLVNATTPTTGSPVTIADGLTLSGVPSANGPITQAYLTNVTATYKAKKDVSAQARKK
jgi:PKD repeat protein